MEEGECPSLWSHNDLHTLSSSNRSIGCVVGVICHHVTIAVLKCLAGGRWNDTKPLCLSDSSLTSTSTLGDQVRLKKEAEMKVETIIIIVWVLGAILLFTLLVLLMVIVTARHKGDLRRNSRRSSVFTVVAEGRRGGGDNPAFIRESEATNWVLHRNARQLPPTYREAMLDRPPRLDNTEPQAEPNPRHQQSLTTENERSRRYAQDYPSCFWEEEPPPPYSLFADGQREGGRGVNTENVSINRQQSRSTAVPDHPVINTSCQPDSVCDLTSNIVHHISTIDVNHSTSRTSISTRQPRSRNCFRSTAQIHHLPPLSLSTQTQPLDQSLSPNTQMESYELSNTQPSSASSQAHRVGNNESTDSSIQTCQSRCERTETTAPLARLEIEYF